MEGDLPASRHGNLKTASSDQTLSDILLQIKSSKTPVSNPNHKNPPLIFSPIFNCNPLKLLNGSSCFASTLVMILGFCFSSQLVAGSYQLWRNLVYLHSFLPSFFCWFQTFVYMHFVRQVFDVLPQWYIDWTASYGDIGLFSFSGVECVTRSFLHFASWAIVSQSSRSSMQTLMNAPKQLSRFDIRPPSIFTEMVKG